MSILLSSIFMPEMEKYMKLAMCYGLQLPFVL